MPFPKKIMFSLFLLPAAAVMNATIKTRDEFDRARPVHWCEISQRIWKTGSVYFYYYIIKDFIPFRFEAPIKRVLKKTSLYTIMDKIFDKSRFSHRGAVVKRHFLLFFNNLLMGSF